MAASCFVVTDVPISLFKGLHFGHMKEYPSSGESWEKRLVTPGKGICTFCSPKKGLSRAKFGKIESR